MLLITLCAIATQLSGAATAASVHLESRDSPDLFDTRRYANRDIIRRDVAVVGGGQTGTYAAINMRDRGQSVVVVERAGRLGGHEATYIDPASGTPIDYGVQTYYNISVVTDFFGRFNVPLRNYSFSGVTTSFADFTTGNVLPNFSMNMSLGAYGAQLARYPRLAYSWDLPSPIPDDFFLPFGEFIEKYNLQDITYGMFTVLGGVANPPPLEQLTINIFKWLDQPYLDGIAGRSVVTERRNNGEIYTLATAELGSDVLLSSTVTAAWRPRQRSQGVKLVVRTPTGNKLIIASRLLVTIPPLVQNMRPFGLDRDEFDLFNRFNYSGYYVGLVNNTGFANGQRFLNVNSNNLYGLPDLPGFYHFAPTSVNGSFLYWYGSPVEISQQQVEAEVIAAVRRLNNGTTQPTLRTFSSHTPFKLVVEEDDIRSGFYERLWDLQGRRNTWYTGAAFLSHNCGGLWNYTHHLLPDVVAGL
ncbi:hypothetical protein S40293_05057 [Stachybotrys chartarum IBT 40293]|nr:hypothetical protein S40293_05057 [Stachybotrys chartarum IBT 40293]